MPVLNDMEIAQLRDLAEDYLRNRPGAQLHALLGAGASAAVFEIQDAGRPRALKVYNPAFFNGSSAAAVEKRRLTLQENLVGHDCPHLVQLYAVKFTGTTCFIDMEYLPGADLNAVLASIPRQAVHLLIQQLVIAVRFLEANGLVHRDIKPQNIRLSADFDKLTLLDLGVIRDWGESSGPDATEQNGRKPFMATAQYSSPEYLFWLHSPSKELWHGLSIYQVGAVLHDLLMRRPLFAEEVAMDNRYALARAVLEKVPSTHAEDAPSWLCALAARCLTKDLHRRLSMVSWADFDVAADRVAKIAQRFAQVRETGILAADDGTEAHARLIRRRALMDLTADHLFSQARVTFEGAQLERIVGEYSRTLTLRIPKSTLIVAFLVEYRWSEQAANDVAAVWTSARLQGEGHATPSLPASKDLCTLTAETVQSVVDALCQQLSENVGAALDAAAVHQGTLADAITLE